MDLTHSSPVKHRDLWMVGLLSAITGGLYNIYLVYRWAWEINGLSGSKKADPSIALLVSVASLGLGVLVFECMFARELESIAEDRGEVPLLSGFSIVIIALTVSEILLIMTGVGFVFGLPLGVAATVLIQRQLNAFVGPASA